MGTEGIVILFSLLLCVFEGFHNKKLTKSNLYKLSYENVSALVDLKQFYSLKKKKAHIHKHTHWVSNYILKYVSLSFCSPFHHKLFESLCCKFHFLFPDGVCHSVGKSPFRCWYRELIIPQSLVFPKEGERKSHKAKEREEDGKRRRPNAEQKHRGPFFGNPPPRLSCTSFLLCKCSCLEVIQTSLIYSKSAVTLLGLSQRVIVVMVSAERVLRNHMVRPSTSCCSPQFHSSLEDGWEQGMWFHSRIQSRPRPRHLHSRAVFWDNVCISGNYHLCSAGNQEGRSDAVANASQASIPPFCLSVASPLSTPGFPRHSVIIARLTEALLPDFMLEICLWAPVVHKVLVFKYAPALYERKVGKRCAAKRGATSPVCVFDEAFSSKRKMDCQPDPGIWHAIMSVHLQLAPYAKSAGANLESKDSPLNHILPKTLVVPIGAGRLLRRDCLSNSVITFLLTLLCFAHPGEAFQCWEITSPFSDQVHGLCAFPMHSLCKGRNICFVGLFWTSESKERSCPGLSVCLVLTLDISCSAGILHPFACALLKGAFKNADALCLFPPMSLL